MKANMSNVKNRYLCNNYEKHVFYINHLDSIPFFYEPVFIGLCLPCLSVDKYFTKGGDVCFSSAGPVDQVFSSGITPEYLKYPDKEIIHGEIKKIGGGGN